MSFWPKSEEAFFTQSVNTLCADNIAKGRGSKTLKNWKPVMHALLIEQPRHRPGGALFEADPWPARSYTFGGLGAKWRRLMKKHQAEEAQVQELDALPWFEFPEELVREIEEELARMRPIWEAQAMSEGKSNCFS